MKTYLVFLSRNKIYTAIQFFGLTIAFGFIILLGAYAKTEFSVGKTHPYAKEIYAIGSSDMIGMTLGTGPEFFPSLPEVKEWTRVTREKEKDVTIDKDYYVTNILAIDSNFFRFFHYAPRLITSSQPELQSHQGVILSETFARKAFGNENPIGRTLTYQKDQTLTVEGIMKDFGPEDLWESVDLIIPMELMKKEYQWMDNFGMIQTFVKLNEGTSPELFKQKLLNKYISYWKDWQVEKGSILWGVSLTRWDDLYFSPLNKWSIRNGNPETVKILLFVALVLLISALFNYINLTVSQTGKRAHEMATRRLLGDSSARIVLRYLQESVLFTFFCGLAGCLIALLIKPSMDQMLSTTIVLTPSLTNIAFLALLLLLTGLVSGLLPAGIVARFKPLDIVKGNFRLQNKLLFSRLFIVAQNVISTVLIAMGLTAAAQMNHLMTLSWGYNTNDLAFIRSWEIGATIDKQQILKERLQALPQVAEVSIARQLPMDCGHNGVHQPGEEEISWLNLSCIDSTAFRMLGFQIIEQYTDPVPGMMWITEETRDRYGISAQKPYFGNTNYLNKVCGIIRNYQSLSPLSTPMPDSHSAVQIIGSKGFLSKQLLRTQGNHQEALKAIRQTCREVSQEILGFPKELPMWYIDDYMHDELTGERKSMMLVLCFMLISILISAFGLFAMSISYSEQQSKRVAVCKVMGASTGSVVWSLSRSFMLLSLLASLIAIPVSIKSIQEYLSEFYYRIDFPWYIIIISVVAAWGVAFASIIGQTLKVALRNPIKSLKAE